MIFKFGEAAQGLNTEGFLPLSVMIVEVPLSKAFTPIFYQLNKCLPEQIGHVYNANCTGCSGVIL